MLVSQQEYSACLEYYSNIPPVFAPQSLPLKWLDECKVRSLFPSVELCSPVCSHLLLEVLKKINYDIYEGLYINFDLWFLICGVLFILEIGEAFKADFIGDAFFFLG